MKYAGGIHINGKDYTIYFISAVTPAYIAEFAESHNIVNLRSDTLNLAICRDQLKKKYKQISQLFDEHGIKIVPLVTAMSQDKNARSDYFNRKSQYAVSLIIEKNSEEEMFIKLRFEQDELGSISP